MKIPFKKLNLGDNEVREVEKLIRSGMIGLGNKVFEFEKMLAEYVGSKYAVAVDSCTSALFLSLKQEPCKEVTIPSMTVPLVADAIFEAGKKVVFNDEVDWVGSMYQLGNTNIYDSAHQLDKNQFAGLPDKAKVCLSFYPTKPIGSADGGAILTNDEEFAQWAGMASTYGRNQSDKYGNSWDYNVEIIGYKRHYTNLQAVICIEQLKRLEETDKRRVEIRDIYNREFGYNNRSLYLYRVRVDRRDDFINSMKEQGVECGVHFKPLHLMKPFKDIPIRGDVNKIMNEYCHTVSLPFYDLLTDSEIGYIIETIKKSPFKILP